MARIRVRFTKLGKIRWTSHRDVARMWERAFRRVGLPLAYTSGFSPRPRVSFGLALPTGHESVAEYLDIELAAGQDAELEGLGATLSAALPIGVDVVALSAIDDRAPSLQEEVSSSTWRCEAVAAEHPGAGGEGPLGDRGLLLATVTARAGELLAAPTVMLTRLRKGVEVTDDIRPSVLSLEVTGLGLDGVAVECELTARPRSLRPGEVLASLDPDLRERHTRRLHQWIERDGARWEPLAAQLDATGAPHVLERAS